MGNPPKPPGRPPVELDAVQQRKLQRVNDRGKEVDRARRELKRVVLEAVDAGVPLRRVAAAGGVAHTTLYEWLSERQSK